MDKNQKRKIEGKKTLNKQNRLESKRSKSNWLRKVRFKIDFTNALG